MKRRKQNIERIGRGLNLNSSSISETYVITAGVAIVGLKLLLSNGAFTIGGGVISSSHTTGNVFLNVLDKGLASIPIFGMSILLMKKHHGENVSWSSIIILLMCAVTTISPVATSRYLLGAVTLGLLIHFFPSFAKGRRFDGVVIIALFVVFPLLTGWARGSDVGTLFEYLTNAISSFTLISGLNWVDFDAFSILCRVVDYVETFGTTDGIQVITAILFFVPRTVWTEKGYMTSELLVNSQTPGAFSNLSSPLMAEAYIDFSWLGVIAIGVIVGLLLASLDYSYWQREQSRMGLVGLLYPYLLGFVIYIMRGSLLYGLMWFFGFAWPSVLFINRDIGDDRS